MLSNSVESTIKVSPVAKVNSLNNIEGFVTLLPSKTISPIMNELFWNLEESDDFSLIKIEDLAIPWVEIKIKNKKTAEK